MVDRYVFGTRTSFISSQWLKSSIKGRIDFPTKEIIKLLNQSENVETSFNSSHGISYIWRKKIIYEKNEINSERC